MFRGSIPQDMRNIIYETVKTWSLVREVFIGCSGNFTVERVMAEIGMFDVHANDVTIYSGAIGSYLAQQPFRLELKPEYQELFGWLAPYLIEQDSAVATIMLATRLTDSLKADGTPKDNAYYQQMLPAFESQWADMHGKTLERVQAVPFNLASYHNGDVVPWAKELPGNAGFISYPPFFSGDYENMFKKLDLLFDWDKPTYEEIGDGHIEEFLAAVTDRPYWAFGTNHELHEFDDYLRGVTQTTNRGMPIYIYASQGVRRVVTPHQDTEPVLIDRLTPGKQIGGEMKLCPLTQPQFQALRSQYMNAHIRPGQAAQAVAVTVDDVLIGVYALSPASSYSPIERSIYMLSDFPVAPSDYPRLSKLVLYAALSQEGKLLAERVANRRVKTLLTTAFSMNPVSMKYRGLFDLYSRKENPDAQDDGDHARQRYQLNYTAQMGQWTLQEGLEEWLKKHSKKSA